MKKRYEIWNGEKQFIGYYNKEIEGRGVTLPQDPAFDTYFGRSPKARTIFYPLVKRDGKEILQVRRKSKRQVDLLLKHGGERCERREEA